MSSVLSSTNDDLPPGFMPAGAGPLIFPAGPVEPFPVITAAELDADQTQLEYLIPGWLVAGQPCILAGPKKCLKTNLLIDLTLSLAGQLPFLGKFQPTAKTRCLLISCESGKTVIQETARRIARAKRCSLADLDCALFDFGVKPLTTEENLSRLETTVRENAVQVLMIDPAYLTLDVGDTASNVFTMGKELRRLTEAVQATGCTLVLCHHTRKLNPQERGQPLELDAIAFSGFPEFARQWVLISRRLDYDPDQPGLHRLWITAGGSAGHSSLWGLDIDEGTQDTDGGRYWDVWVIPAKEATRQMREQASDAKADRAEARRLETEKLNRQRVLNALQSIGSPATRNAIKDKAGMSDQTCRAAVDDLLDRGELYCQPNPARSNSILYSLEPIEPGESATEPADLGEESEA